MAMHKKPRRRAAMVNWYDPPRLASTAVRVAVSTVFGEFADRREGMAAAREIDPCALDPAYDYSTAEGNLWIDFIADTADGWNSTYAMARLLASKELVPAGSAASLPRGRLLIMGGDQVYPTASRLDYHIRLVTPFDEAAKGQITSDDRPDVFAIPGNHDWYDGLNSFMGLFCSRRTGFGQLPEKGRTVTGRRTQQTRSYFALKLPGGFWLWGVDIQLSGYVDQPQISFFDHVAKSWMAPGSKLILCVGEPLWSHRDTEAPGSPEAVRFKNFAYLEYRAAHAGHHIKLVMTGDSHHYARHCEGGRHYITAGGGGAFLHPTHHLPEKVTVHSELPPPEQVASPRNADGYSRTFTIARKGGAEGESLFPDRATSRRLAAGNLLFAVRNWQFTAVMAAVAMVFTWVMATNARMAGSNLAELLAAPASGGPWEAIATYLGIAAASPWPALLAAFALGGYYYFSDFRPAPLRLATGALHALAQAVSLMLVTIAAANIVAGWSYPNLWLVALGGIVGGMVSATVFGLYLYISLNVFRRHYNEAFSSLAIPHYKNFIRMRISQEGELTVYPVGLKEIPADDEGGTPRNPELKPHLIEDPIRIQ